MNIKTEVSISIENLYKAFGERLYLNKICTSFSNGTTYYDMYNEYGELACIDGEYVSITQTGNGLISFKNGNGEYTIYFALTKKEAELAVIGGLYNE